MNPSTSIGVALIGAITAIGGAWFTASATTSTHINQIDTKVQVLETTQSLQYNELKEGIGDLKASNGRIEERLGTLPTK